MYDEMSHDVVCLFSTPNLGNYQGDMTISPLFSINDKLCLTVKLELNTEEGFMSYEDPEHSQRPRALCI